MSIPKKVNICCSKCGKLFETTVFESVNSNYTKDIAKQIMSGSLFEAECPHCKYMSHLEYDTLYHDMKHNAMIWVVHEESSNYESKISEIRSIRDLPYKTMRIVEDMNALKEKVSCLEKHRDDRVIELCKVFISYDIFSKKPDFKFKNVFYSIIDGDEKIWFYENEDNGIYCNLSNEIYDKVKELYYKSPYLTQFDNNYPIIDYSWAEDIFDALAELESENTSIDSKYEKSDDTSKNSVICPKCNVQLPDDSIFCPNCGCNLEEAQKQIKAEEKSEPEKVVEKVVEKIVVKKNKTNKLLVFLLILLLIASSVLGYFTYTYYQQSKDYSKEVKELTDSNKILMNRYDETSVARDALQMLESYENWGYATENFHTDTSVLVLNKYSDAKEITLYSTYGGATFNMNSSEPNVANAIWTEETWYDNTTTIRVKPLKTGVSVLTITNDRYDNEVKILVIVVG